MARRSGAVFGFNVGFNAVDSVVRQAEEAEERERRNKREDERFAFEKERMDRERSKAADLAAAAEAPTQGKAVGGNFAAGAADQQFLQDQDAAIAELEGRAPTPVRMAASAGNRIVDPNDPMAQNTRAGYLARVADVQRRHGDVTGSISTEELARNIEKSGLKNALDFMLAGGDSVRAQQMLTEAGSIKINGELVATPTMRKGPNDVQMPDLSLAVKRPDGSVQQLGSALQMRFMADNPAQYLQLLNQEGKARADEKTNATKIAMDREKLDLERERVGLTRSRVGTLNAATRAEMQQKADEAKAASGPRYRELSTTDQKALGEIIANMGAEDPVTATSIATRIIQANANIDLNQAAILATTPGVTVKDIETKEHGITESLVIPGDGTRPARAVAMSPRVRSLDVPPEKKPDEPAKKEKSTLQRVIDRFTGDDKPAEKKDGKAAEKKEPEKKEPENKSGLSASTEAIGKRLDSARAESKAAEKKLNSFGTKQQKADPEGFAAAKTARERAIEAVEKAQAEYEAAVKKELPSRR